ncbi:HAD family hydrolase [Mycoplasmopsis citelli]|uniref:COF family HAD hydrolase protein n=1 Tax=Mycoplasmopsis citelli TaxID=171281 RepID=A0A449B2B7_9BACT|nr:Cof-type HAD-IIB family hydrolase [Mycoplasmopsis citelli]UUD36179.1 HAD family hydrolase [Mycoplasmopsis citelli]VEU74674.1 COF family HAD hydrolase protein [Mycoplasmopsis citelli]
MQNKYLFAFDLDGTLLKRNGTIDPLTQQALTYSEQKGHYNVLATGRGILKVKHLIKNKIIQNIHFAVCSNGSIIWDVNNDKINIYGKLSKEVYYKVRKYALEHELLLNFDTDVLNGTLVATKNQNQYPTWMTDDEKKRLKIFNRLKLEQCDDLSNLNSTNLLQMSLKSSTELWPIVTNKLKEELKDQAIVCLTNFNYTDINPIGISKYQGIKKLLGNLNLSKENLIAFGDSGNDCEMLRNSRFGFCMSNGTPEAKNIASEIIGDHESDTIGKKIFELINQTN